MQAAAQCPPSFPRNHPGATPLPTMLGALMLSPDQNSGLRCTTSALNCGKRPQLEWVARFGLTANRLLFQLNSLQVRRTWLLFKDVIFCSRLFGHELWANWSKLAAKFSMHVGSRCIKSKPVWRCHISACCCPASQMKECFMRLNSSSLLKIKKLS